ncbi:MAG: metallophosphatase domain-containing protein [Cyclobacteriaceae bacterium]|nr:MAG: metallophosphatase domain-containing protein [Cyclobacteriaceae bacterium]
MKIVCISDTHGRHRDVQLPFGDMIIHAGDVSAGGTESQVKDFLMWFSEQEFRYKIFIAGNHDFLFEHDLETAKGLIPENVIYLQESSITIEGHKIYGTPITPYFLNWAFNRHPGEDIEKHINKIPSDIDILISHGPPYGILDINVNGQHCGCPALLSKVEEIKPKLSVCGHIHENYGQIQNGKTTFVNASLLNEKYRHQNTPITIQL